MVIDMKYFKKSFYRVKFEGADAPLPFSVRSAGHYLINAPDKEYHAKRNFVQLFWSLRGKGMIVINGREYTFAEQQVCYYPSGEDHILQPVDMPWEYRWFTFDGPLADALMRGFQYPRKPFYAGHCPEELFETLGKRIHDATITEMRNLTSIAWQILSAAGAAERAVGRDEKLLLEFFACVRDNYSNVTVNINTIADLMIVHRSTLTRIIRQHTGMTPGVYLYDFRLQKALKMLRLADIPIGEVATACGIADPCYFSRVIHRAVTCSPVAYRKRYRLIPFTL
jgi:AraC-like DNA-binding protein